MEIRGRALQVETMVTADSQRPETAGNGKGTAGMEALPQGLKGRNLDLGQCRPHAASSTGYQQVSCGTNWLPQNYTGFLTPACV